MTEGRGLVEEVAEGVDQAEGEVEGAGCEGRVGGVGDEGGRVARGEADHGGVEIEADGVGDRAQEAAGAAEGFEGASGAAAEAVGDVEEEGALLGGIPAEEDVVVLGVVVPVHGGVLPNVRVGSTLRIAESEGVP